MTRYRHLITDDNRKWWTLGAMCFALFMVMLDNTVVNVALPSIQRELNTSISGLEWIVNGYTLSFAVLLATGGRLGDIFGRRRIFIGGVALFTLASATAGLAPSNTALVASRVAQGIGAAFMMPGTLSIITNAFPVEERGRAIGTWAGVSALALAIGPVLGGFLVEHVSWRAIFYINLPVGVGAIIATLFAVRESRDTTVGREVDILGVSLLTAGLTALVLALVEGNSWGWESTAVISLLVASVALLVSFVVAETRVKAPIIDFHLFGSRNFIGAVVVAFIISFSMLGVFFFLALYMQNVLGYTALEAGVRFLPTTLVIMVVAPISGRLSDRYGPRWPITVGLALTALSLYSFSTISVSTTFSDLIFPFVLLGFGIALTMSPMSTAAMNAVDKTKAGVASGVLSMFRMIGGTFGVASLGALFQTEAQSKLDQLLSGSQLAPGQRSGIAAQLSTGNVSTGSLPASEAKNVAAAGHDAFIYALSHSMRLSTAVACVGVVVGWAMIRATTKPDADRSAEGSAAEEVASEAAVAAQIAASCEAAIR